MSKRRILILRDEGDHKTVVRSEVVEVTGKGRRMTFKPPVTLADGESFEFWPPIGQTTVLYDDAKADR